MKTKFRPSFLLLAAPHMGSEFPDQWIEPVLPAVEVRSHNHWTTREVPNTYFLYRNITAWYCSSSGNMCYWELIMVQKKL